MLLRIKQFAYKTGVRVDDEIFYLLHKSLSHIVRIKLFDFSSEFNTTQPILLRSKMENSGVHQSMVNWLTDYLSNRPQYVRMQDCVSQVVKYSTGVPQAPFLFTFYISDF